jgi:hypothetical protein
MVCGKLDILCLLSVHDRDFDVVFRHVDPQELPRILLDEREKVFRREELDPVVSPEMPSLVVVPVVPARLGIAFARITDKGPAAFRKLAVGDDVHALVADQPQAASRLIGIEAVGRAVAVVRSSVRDALIDELFDGGKRKVNMRVSFLNRAV